jgi:hypothetical protein
MESTSIYNVTCVNKGVGETNPIAHASFNYVNLKISQRFTCVAASGKTKNYSRVELLQSIFRGN